MLLSGFPPHFPSTFRQRVGSGGNPDKSMSADFYPLCVACIDRHGPKHVKCPKHNAIMTNISAGVPYSDVVFEDLGFRPVWEDPEGKKLAAPIPNPHAAG